MNIKEVLRKENVGKEYEVEGYVYEVVESFNGNLNLKNINTHNYIEYELSLFDIINCEFEEHLDWSKVSVDAKVLVSDNGKLWYKRHFAKYENGSVHVSLMDVVPSQLKRVILYILGNTLNYVRSKIN